MDKGFEEFIAAITNDDLEKVKELFPLYQKEFTGFGYYGNPLFTAIRYSKDMSVLKYLLENGVSLDQISMEYQRPIYYSILIGHYDCIPLLIEAKANVNDFIEHEKTVLDKCLTHLNSVPPSTIHLLLDHGAKHNHPIPEKQLPLFASRQSCKNAARILYALLRRRLRVANPAYPSGWPIPAALAREMARLVWVTRRDADTWSESKRRNETRV